jgi:predicted permease
MMNDLRLAIRSLCRSPIFTLASIGTLALGIAASTAIFSLFYQVLLRSLPVPEPERLVLLHSDPPPLPGGTSADNDETVFSNPMYVALRDGATQFQGLAARSSENGQLTGESTADRIRLEIVSGNFFQILGLLPAAGRLLQPSDDLPNQVSESVAVLSYSYWVEHFGGSLSALHQVTHINGQPFTIVGVAPASFSGILSASKPDLFVPINARPLILRGWLGLNQPGAQWLTIFGRLNPGVTRSQALVSLQPVWKSTLRQHIDLLNINDADYRRRALNKPLALHSASQGINQLEAQWHKPLNALLAMVILLLLIACANVANLLVARALARRRDVAIRVALGANRWRLLRLSLAESVLIAFAGGLAGVALAFGFLRLLLTALPQRMVGTTVSARLDPSVLVFIFLAVLLTNLLFGFLPALFTSRADSMPALKDQSANTSASGSHTRWRRLLVAAQLGLSLALLVGAGLFGKSLSMLLSHNPGFVPEHLLTFTLDSRLSGYTMSGGSQIYDEILQRLRNLPNVESAAIAETGPLFNSRSRTNVSVEGFTPANTEEANSDINAVGPGYFHTLETPLIAGREFTIADNDEAQFVAIVNQAFAQHFFAGQSPIGKHMHRGSNGPPFEIEIVGLVRDTNTVSLRDAQSPAYYVPLDQYWAAEREIRHSTMHSTAPAHRASFFVRSTANLLDLERDLRKIVHAIAPNVPVYDLKTMTERVNDSIYTERLSALLALLFGAVAALLAAVGLYGVVAYSVTRRTPEIGIRLALGAVPSHVLRLVMQEVAVLAAISIFIGIPAALAMAQLMNSQLYGVEPGSVEVFLAAVSVVLTCALLAGFIPAYRASRVDPKEALRYE